MLNKDNLQPLGNPPLYILIMFIVHAQCRRFTSFRQYFSETANLHPDNVSDSCNLNLSRETRRNPPGAGAAKNTGTLEINVLDLQMKRKT